MDRSEAEVHIIILGDGPVHMTRSDMNYLLYYTFRASFIDHLLFLLGHNLTHKTYRGLDSRVI
jgi:hypothetical protein